MNLPISDLLRKLGVPVRDVHADFESQQIGSTSKVRSKMEVADSAQDNLDRLTRTDRILHDVNNFLLVIDFSCRQLLTSIPAESPQRAAVTAIDQARRQARELTRQHNQFVSEMERPVSSADLNEIVTRLALLVRPLLNENIILRSTLTASDTAIQGDSASLGYAILILILNAANSARQGGWITLTTQVDPGDSKSHLDSHTSAFRSIILEITDTGAGLPQAIGPQTSPPAQDLSSGTPIALANELINSIGGTMTVIHSADSGTTIHLRFLSPGQSVDWQSAADQDNYDHGHETILLVDDELLVRRLVTRILEDHGYTVISTADEPSAIAEVINHTAAIQLLLADMNLPGSSGLQVANKLRTINPDLVVVMMSGSEMDADESIPPEFSCLQKPFDPIQLLKQVRQALDGQLRCR